MSDINENTLQNHVLSSVCYYKLTETYFYLLSPKEIPTAAISHYLALLKNVLSTKVKE